VQSNDVAASATNRQAVIETRQAVIETRKGFAGTLGRLRLMILAALQQEYEVATVLALRAHLPHRMQGLGTIRSSNRRDICYAKSWLPLAPPTSMLKVALKLGVITHAQVCISL